MVAPAAEKSRVRSRASGFRGGGSRDFAVEPDAIHQQMYVLVLRIVVPRDQVLVVV
jgi:hypothetical protein